MEVAGVSLEDLSWLLQLAFIVISFWFLNLVKNTASKYFEVDGAADRTAEMFSVPVNDPTCALCGVYSVAKCSRCKAVRYCSPKCQILHWRSGHRTDCNDILAGGISQAQSTSKRKNLEPKAKGTMAKECDMELLVTSPILETQDSELNPQQSEPGLRYSNAQPVHVPGSASRISENISANTCQNVDEDNCSPIDPEAISIFSGIFGAGFNKRWGAFIITEIQMILGKLNSSLTPGAILDCQGEVLTSLGLLKSIFETLGSGNNKFEWFAARVGQIFELADQLSKDMKTIEAGSTLDIEQIRNLIRSYEECQAARKSLELELSGLDQQLRDLKATEKSIVKVEKKAQKLRKDYETAKIHLEKKISWSKDSFERQNKLHEELCQARIEAENNKLAEFEHVQSSHKTRQGELKKLLSLFEVTWAAAYIELGVSFGANS